MSDAADMIRRWHNIIEAIPKPRFDRVVVHGRDIFDGVPRHKPRPWFAAYSTYVNGIPVLVDTAVEPGVIELRFGDEVIERVRLGGEDVA